MKNKLSLRLIRYEIINASSNIFTLIFSIAFPLFLSMLFSFMFSTEIPDIAVSDLNANLYITMIMVIPLASMFIGHAANYSQELENGSLQRFKLFGYKERTLFAAKVIANLIFLTAALIIYSGVMFLVLDLTAPTFAAFTTLIIFLYVLTVILLILSQAIATFFGKFGPTFGVSMALYFVFMTLGGMMGFSVSNFPVFLQYISKALPMYYICENLLTFWLGGSYDFLPLCLSLLGLAAVSVGLLALSVWINKKGAKKKKQNQGVTWE